MINDVMNKRFYELVRPKEELKKRRCPDCGVYWMTTKYLRLCSVCSEKGKYRASKDPTSTVMRKKIKRAL